MSDVVEITFAGWPRRKLERVAVAHAVDVALAYDRPPGDAPVERLVVNMARHGFTSYDADPTRPGRLTGWCVMPSLGGFGG